LPTEPPANSPTIAPADLRSAYSASTTASDRQAALGSTIVRFAEAWQRHGNQNQYQEHCSLQLPGGDAVMLSCAELHALPELCAPLTRLWQLTVGGV
jgi:hypothetical protein